MSEDVMDRTTRRSPAEFAAWMREAHGVEGALSYTGFLARTAGRVPDRTALIYEDRRYTYAELFRAIADAGEELRSLWSIAPGERVALLSENSDTLVIWYLAVLDIGAVGVSLNPKLTPSEMRFMLENCGAGLVIHDRVFTTTLDETGAGVRRRDMAVPPAGDGARRPRVAVAVEQPAAIYYTSGTTGRPKGVVLSHANLIAIALQSPRGWEYEIEPLVALGVTPLFHIAQHTITLPILHLGGTLILGRYHTSTIFDLLERYQVTSFFAVPSMLLMMLAMAGPGGRPIPSVRQLQFGASPMPAQKLREVQAMFPNAGMVHGMGQTESCGTLVTLASRLAFDKAGSVGTPLDGCVIRIVDDEDRPLAPREVGELIARGPNVMLGYYGDPAATASALRHGWLHTGDLGYLDEDGYVFLVDRKKDMLIRGGENIYSTEVEAALQTHPEVTLAAVVGVPDPVLGEVPFAFLLCRDPERPPAPREIAEHVASMLAAYKIPRLFAFLAEMPMTATSKIQKAPLRTRAAELASAMVAEKPTGR